MRWSRPSPRREAERAMSEENVEVLKRSVVAHLRGVHRGREGARELFAGFREPFPSITPLSTEYMEVGDKVVLAARVRFRGRGSGLEVGGGGVGAVYTLPDGKIVRCEHFKAKPKPSKAPGCGSSSRSPSRDGQRI